MDGFTEAAIVVGGIAVLAWVMALILSIPDPAERPFELTIGGIVLAFVALVILLPIGHNKESNARHAHKTAHVERQLNVAKPKLRAMKVVENGTAVTYHAGTGSAFVICEASVRLSHGQPVFQVTQQRYEPPQPAVCLKELEAATKS